MGISLAMQNDLSIWDASAQIEWAKEPLTWMLDSVTTADFKFGNIFSTNFYEEQ